MKLSIALPGLLWHDAGDIDYIAPQLKHSNLDRLIKRASISKTSDSFSDLVYSGYLGQTSNSKSLATIMARQLPGLEQYTNFLIAEPTFLRADRDRLLICESELLQLSDDETETIIKAINEHFNGTIRVYPIKTSLWVIGLNFDISDNQFYPILDIIGENIDDYLPKKTNALELTNLINEIQMLLFSLELNQIRKNEGLLQINSLWLWDKSIKADLISNYSHIFTNIKSINSAKIKSLPNSIGESFIDNSLIIIDKLYYPCCYRDSYSYVHNLSLIDKQIAATLSLKQIDHLEVLVPGIDGTLIITLRKNDKYKFWKNTTFLQLLRAQR